MEIRSPEEILQEIEETRQQIGTVSMILDGAQVHVIIEGLVEALKVIAELLIVSKNTESDEWPAAAGSQENSIKSARELGFTTISTIKIFMEALPDNLRDFDKKITPDTLNLIENFFKGELDG